MFKKELRNNLPTTLIWLAIITLLRWSWPLPSLGQAVGFVLLWLGGLVGTFLLDLDHVLYTLAIYPQEETSKRVRQLVGRRFYREALLLIFNTRGERTKLVFHSVIFQIILAIFCFFVLTSTGSSFGAGLVMAMALRFLREELTLLLKGRGEELRNWLFWQVKAEIPLRQQKFFVIIMLLVFLGLNLLLI